MRQAIAAVLGLLVGVGATLIVVNATAATPEACVSALVAADRLNSSHVRGWNAWNGLVHSSTDVAAMQINLDELHRIEPQLVSVGKTYDTARAKCLSR